MAEFFHMFQTGRILAFLQQAKVGELISDPWFLGGAGLVALISLIMRWRLLLVTTLSVTGFVGLISYTIQQETDVQNLSSDALLTFVGGGCGLILLVIYLLFIKSD